MKTASPTSETEIILLAIAKEKLSFARLAAAAQACDNPKAKRLYNQLALDELKHLLTLVSLMDGLAGDWLTRLDLTLPLADRHDTLPQTEEAILRSTMEEEELSENFFGQIQERCRRFNIPSGGHLLMEEGLVAHVPLYGDFFRCIRRLDALIGALRECAER
ncbi:MAG: hypothetical protein AABY63_04975, partial [candidate division NC10 bacterium]